MMKSRFNSNGPEPAVPTGEEQAIHDFTGSGARYYVFKWKYARGLSSWNWAAFFLGPVWFALRKNYAWAAGSAAFLVLNDWLASPAPYHFTASAELLVASGWFANSIYRAKFRRALAATAPLPGEDGAGRQRLKSQGGKDWTAAAITFTAMLLATLLLPSLFGVQLFHSRYIHADVRSAVRDAFGPDRREADLLALRQDYQQAGLRGEFKRGLEVNRNTLRLSVHKFGPTYPLTIGIQNDLIENLLKSGDFREAERLTDEAMKKYQLQFGADHPFVAFVQNHRVSAFLEQGLYDRAKSESNNLLLLLEKYPSRDEHPVILANLAAIYSNLALIQQRYCEYDLAEKNHLEALGLAIQASDRYSLFVCVYLERLGDFYLEQAKWDEAKGYYDQAGKITEKILGAKNPLMASILCRQAELHYFQRQYFEADNLLQRAHLINLDYHGAAHPATAETARWLARTAFAAGKLAEAETRVRESLDSMRRAVGEDNALYADLLAQQGELLAFRGDWTAAYAALQSALATEARIYGEDSPRLLAVLEPLAEACAKRGNALEAREVENRAQRIKNGSPQLPPSRRVFEVDSNRLTL